MSQAVIIGGGPAGSAAAIALACAGRRPLLLERDAAAAEKVCGEFLAEDAARRLDGLGAGPAALGALGLRRAIFAAGRRHAELALPFPAWSLPRARLDAALLQAARDAGATVALGMAARGAVACGDGWQVTLGSGEVLPVRSLVLATGKHELRGLRRAARGSALGLKLPLHGDVPEAAVTLLFCAGGYAGLQPRPDGGANLCAALDARAAGVAAAARSAEALIAHVARGSLLAERLLAGVRPALARPMAVAGVPYGFRHRGGGPFRVGDQAAVIASICGDGIAMALRSGLRAAAAVQGGAAPEAYHAALARENAAGMLLASASAMLARCGPAVAVSGIAVAPGVARAVARQTRLG
jgi:flavin-dependent dehydrogenase